MNGSVWPLCSGHMFPPVLRGRARHSCRGRKSTLRYDNNHSFSPIRCGSSGHCVCVFARCVCSVFRIRSGVVHSGVYRCVVFFVFLPLPVAMQSMHIQGSGAQGGVRSSLSRGSDVVNRPPRSRVGAACRCRGHVSMQIAVYLLCKKAATVAEAGRRAAAGGRGRKARQRKETKARERRDDRNKVKAQ